jgi:hypothetical protein
VSLQGFGEGWVRQLPLGYQVYIVSYCRMEEVSKKLKRQRGSIFSVASNAGPHRRRKRRGHAKSCFKLLPRAGKMFSLNAPRCRVSFIHITFSTWLVFVCCSISMYKNL